MTAAPSVDGREELLVVGVDDRRFALRARDVAEVQPIVWIEPLPGAPDVVEGVVDVRGAVVPVLDLRRRFGLPPAPLDLHDRLVLVDARGRRIALHVGGTADLHEVPIAALDVSAPPEAGPGAAGVVRLADGLVVLQDLAAFLDDDTIVALDAALADADGSA